MNAFDDFDVDGGDNNNKQSKRLDKHLSFFPSDRLQT